MELQRNLSGIATETLALTNASGMSGGSAVLTYGATGTFAVALSSIYGGTGIKSYRLPVGETGAPETLATREWVSGLTGSGGYSGSVGAQGVTGANGPPGATGLDGAQGYTGLAGGAGSQGVTGLQGIDGAQGVTGPQGIDGAQGVTGAEGLMGSQGVTGFSGLEGQTGTQGATGINGIQGYTGADGLQGVTGIVGATGVQGYPGAASDQWMSVLSADENNLWYSVAYGGGVFVAAAMYGGANRFMRSADDGLTWTLIIDSASEYTNVKSVTYGGGVFVAVLIGGRDFTLRSTDYGISWSRVYTGVVANTWSSVAYGGGSFVALATSGSNPRTMHSSDGGLTWAGVASPDEGNSWISVTYGNGTFVGVAENGTSARTMYSTDYGASWTAVEPSDTIANWTGVTFGDGVFVACGYGSTSSSSMRSVDYGRSWVSATTALSALWSGITFGKGAFVAVAYGGGTAGRVMHSVDGGVTWTQKMAASNTSRWYGIAFGNDTFIAVSSDTPCTMRHGLYITPGPAGATGTQGATGLAGTPGTQGVTGTAGLDGPTGAQGITGLNGLDGAQGVTGFQGLTGPVGTQGVTGANGLDGAQGATGVAGLSGETGAQGLQGFTGVYGATGMEGIQGTTGVNGPEGFQGLTGAQGITGIQGLTGIRGDQGSTGEIGVTGVQGVTGTQGVQGNTGSDGIQGLTGLQGLTGANGIQGLTGSQGVQGTTGVRGITGVQGTTGVQGYTGIQGFTGIQGYTGVQGYTGPDWLLPGIERQTLGMVPYTVQATLPSGMVSLSTTNVAYAGGVAVTAGMYANLAGTTGVSTSFRSTDYGKTWSEVALPNVPSTTVYPFSVAGYGSTFIAVNVNGTVLRSTNAGVTWSAVTAPANTTTCVVCAGTNNFVSVARKVTTANKVMYSADNGATWTLTTAADGMAGTEWWFISSANDVVFLMAPWNAGYAPKRSTDGGSTWADIATSATLGGYVAYGAGYMLSVELTTGTVSRSSNNGATWADISTVALTSYDTGGIAYLNGAFVYTNSIGIAVSYDNGSTWVYSYKTGSVAIAWYSMSGLVAASRVVLGSGSGANLAYRSELTLPSADSVRGLTLQAMYDRSSVSPEILLDATHGAVSIKAIADANNSLEILNSAGVERASIKGNGTITASGIINIARNDPSVTTGDGGQVYFGRPSDGALSASIGVVANAATLAIGNSSGSGSVHIFTNPTSPGYISFGGGNQTSGITDTYIRISTSPVASGNIGNENAAHMGGWGSTYFGIWGGNIAPTNNNYGVLVKGDGTVTEINGSTYSYLCNNAAGRVRASASDVLISPTSVASEQLSFRKYTGSSAAAIYNGANMVAASNTNYSLYASGTGTILNAPSTAVSLAVGHVYKLACDATSVTISPTAVAVEQFVFMKYTNGGYAAIYNGGQTPASTNYLLLSNATGTLLNAPSGGQVNLRVANNVILAAQATDITTTVPLVVGGQISSGVSTGGTASAITWNLSTDTYFYSTATLANSGTLTVTMTSDTATAGSTNYLFYKQAATSASSIILSYTGANFRLIGSNTATNSPITLPAQSSSLYYRIALHWVTTAVCYVSIN